MEAGSPSNDTRPRSGAGAVAEQLNLIYQGREDWRLDARTREIGLRGVAEARRILAEAQSRAGESRAA